MQEEYYSEELNFSPERLKKRVDWRPLFSDEILREAESEEFQNRIRDFQSKEEMRYY